MNKRIEEIKERALESFKDHEVEELVPGQSWRWGKKESNAHCMYITKLPADGLAITGDCGDILFNRYRGFEWLKGMLDTYKKHGELSWSYVYSKTLGTHDSCLDEGEVVEALREYAAEPGEEDQVQEMEDWLDTATFNYNDGDFDDLATCLYEQDCPVDTGDFSIFKKIDDSFYFMMIGVMEFFKKLKGRTPVLDEDGGIKSFLITLTGKEGAAYCPSCKICNVFHKPDDQDEDLFRCNACGAEIESE